MNVAEGRRVPTDHDIRAPIRYQEEVDRRRHQERRDEALARRMQMLGVDDDPSDDVVGEGNSGQVFGVGNGADHFLNHHFRQQARNILTSNFPQAARAAERLLNGAVTGRENPLPPAPFELEAPARNAADQTAQLLRQDSSLNVTLNNRLDLGRRVGKAAASRGVHEPSEPSEPSVPLPPSLSGATRRRSPIRYQSRRASVLESLLAGDRSQTADERTAEQRIENWRSDVPVGEPADSVMLV